MSKNNLMVKAKIQDIPERITDTDVLQMLQTNEIDWKYVSFIKDLSQIKDELLSEWLNVNVKTFRSYKKQNSQLKENLQEKVILLISLYKHGLKVFGEIDHFNRWLDKENFFLENDKPINYLKTITGIRFIDNRLTSIEYGDNV